MQTPIIRLATVHDIPQIVAMGERFVDETSYRVHLTKNPTQMADLAARLICGPEGLLLVAERGDTLIGMIGFYLFHHVFSGELTATDVFWWVNPEHRGIGVRLLRAAERWALTHGAVVLQMVAPTDHVGAFYERLGYHKVEAAYQKRV